jgi:hypothetical protein
LVLPQLQLEFSGHRLRVKGQNKSERQEKVGIVMELKDTVELMTSKDWKDRFKAEYLQTRIRYEKLHDLVVKREVGKHYFDTPISLESWKTQARYMGLYLYELEKQAVLHGIELPKT